jgi:hypothetical protein
MGTHTHSTHTHGSMNMGTHGYTWVHTHTARTRMAQESAGTRAKASPESPEPTSGGVCDQFDPFDPW